MATADQYANSIGKVFVNLITYLGGGNKYCRSQVPYLGNRTGAFVRTEYVMCIFFYGKCRFRKLCFYDQIAVVI